MTEQPQQTHRDRIDISAPTTSPGASAKWTAGILPAPEECVDITGDCYVALTAPFYLRGFSLTDPATHHIDMSAAFSLDTFLRQDLPFSSLTDGTLTYPDAPTDSAVGFVGGRELCVSLRDVVAELVDSETEIVDLSVCGTISSDLIGAVSVAFKIERGWCDDHIGGTIEAVGRGGRSRFADIVRERLLPELTRLVAELGSDPAAQVALPYFNMTYAGRTTTPEPGRSALRRNLRSLVYPNGSGPLTSESTWYDEFFYPGYAFNLLITPHPKSELDRFVLLLLILDVHYWRLARTADQANDAIQNHELFADAAALAELERKLRLDYMELVTPTFSYDYRVLRMRDEVLKAWHTERLHARAQGLLAALRQSVERRLAESQDRRDRRLNAVVIALTLLSSIATVDAAIGLYDYFIK